MLPFREENAAIADWEQEEFAVLDRAGRLQIPRELLDEMNLTDNKVRIQMKDGQIVIENPKKK